MANQQIENTLLTTTPTTAHTVSGGQVGAIVRLEFMNFGSSNRAITVWFVPSGDTLGNQHKFIALAGSSLIAPGKMLHLNLQAHLQAGDAIAWAADVSNEVRAGGSVKEVTKNGHENIEAQYLGTSLAEVYQVTSGYAMTILSFLLCNQSVSDAGVELQIIPQGQSAASKHKYLSVDDLIAPGETRLFRWPNHFESAGASIQAKADTSSAVVIAGAVFEEAT